MTELDWTALGGVRDMVATVLDEAAAILVRNGWTQGRWRDDESGSVDLVCALADAVGIDLTAVDRRDVRLPTGGTILLGAALTHLRAHLGVAYLTIWNDLPERTVEDVLHLLTTTSTDLREFTCVSES